jgi:hypothetical protein
MDYLETQKKLLLVSKIVDKNKKPSSGGGGESESEDGGGTKHKTTGTALFADLEAVYNPNEVSQYTIGVNTDNIKKRTVNDVNMPMVRGGLTAANLKLVIDPKASPDLKTQQITLCKTRLLILTQTSLRFISRDNFRTLLGNSAEAVKQFISEDAVIAPMRICLLYLCLWMLGKIRTQDMLKLTPMKLDARRAFIKSLRAS